MKIIFSLLGLSFLLVPSALLSSKKHIPLDLALQHNNQGAFYLARNDMDRAEVEFKTAAELDPLYAEAHNNLGLIYKYKGYLDLAEAPLKTALKLEPKWAAPYNHLGTVYLARSEFNKALTQFRKAIALDTKFADAYYNLGVVFLERAKDAVDPKTDWKNAVKVLQKATTISTGHYQAHLNLADTYQKLGENEKAILRYRVAIEVNPRDPVPWEHLAVLYTEGGDLKKAQECEEKARLLKPMTERNLVKEGEDFVKKKKWDDALALFQRALQANPNNPMIHFDIGYVFTLQGQYPRAVPAYQRAIALDPNFFAAYFNLGDALMKINNVQAASQSFAQALRLKPDHAESLYQFGQTMMAARNGRGALVSFCRFLQVAGSGLKDEIVLAQKTVGSLGGCPQKK